MFYIVSSRPAKDYIIESLFKKQNKTDVNVSNPQTDVV